MRKLLIRSRRFVCEIRHVDVEVIHNFSDHGDIVKRCSFVAIFDNKHTRDKIVRPVDVDFVEQNVYQMNLSKINGRETTILRMQDMRN